jgi:hypothetical protein
MGGSSTKPVAPKPTAPTIDFSAAKFDASYVQQLQQQAAAAVAAANKQAAELAASTGLFSKAWVKIGGSIFLLITIVIVGLLIHDVWARAFGGATYILPGGPTTQPIAPAPSTDILYVDSATYGVSDSNPAHLVDVTPAMRGMIQNSLTLPSFTVGYETLGLTSQPVSGQVNTLTVNWYTGYNNIVTTTAQQGSTFPSLPTANQSKAPQAPMQSPTPPMLSKLWGYMTGGSGSGNLVSGMHDASGSAVIKGNNAPLSGESDGAYGIQWWMYIQDWNYGYGKKKTIVKRPDATNPGVTNPSISLHPTDNSLQVTVSLFPDKEGSSGKSTPAPAGHSSSTDDVFTCEVPNVPLQTWFSVSATVFGRNLDVYIDGKLVKSCFLPGVPKPAAGDIQLTPDGGFSGKICDFYHYSRMLTPGDAMNFWSAGTSCKSSTGPTTASTTTGYSVKFGVYDAVGKQVQQYTF